MDCSETAGTQLFEMFKVFLGKLWIAHKIEEVFIEEIR
jgi:hypothetical protein